MAGFRDVRGERGKPDADTLSHADPSSQRGVSSVALGGMAETQFTQTHRGPPGASLL